MRNSAGKARKTAAAPSGMSLPLDTPRRFDTTPRTVERSTSEGSRHRLSSLNSYQTEYFETWKEAFAQFLGWSVEQTASWAQPLLEDLELPGMVLNEPPFYYVARELASNQSFYDELSRRDEQELILAIEAILGPDHARNFPPGFDFDAAKRKLETLLRAGFQG